MTDLERKVGSEMAELVSRYADRAKSISSTFGVTNKLDHRLREYHKKRIDLENEHSSKNVADLFLSVVWLGEIEPAHSTYPLGLGVLMAICEDRNTSMTELGEAVDFRLNELQQRIDTTGTAYRS